MKNICVLDNTAIQYMLESFPRKLMEEVWRKFEQQCSVGESISDKETRKILESDLVDMASNDWISANCDMFKSISQKESQILGELIKNGVFDFYNNSAQLARKLPVSIPFIISIAISQKRTLVIQKGCKDIKKIQEICKVHNVKCIEVEEYLLQLKDETLLD